MSANCFRGTAQQFVDLSPLYFYPWGHLKTLVYSALIENKETLHQHILMPVKPFAIALGPSKVCDNARSGVPRRSLIEMKDILSICCELLRDK
jgi:hypothetical protein